MPPSAVGPILPIAVFAAILAALGIAAFVFLRQFPLTWVQRFLYLLDIALCKVLWRATVHGRLGVAPGQGAVLVCNHRSSVDPCFLQLTTPRVVHWMVAKEYYTYWASGWFLRTVETIPVSRGGIDTAAVMAAIRYARQGTLVGIFPEGRLNTTNQVLLPGRPGAALIALKARVPVIPCFLRGGPASSSVLRPLVTPSRTELWVGQPIDLSEYYGREDERGVLEDMTKRILREMARLGGYPDFQPSLAGRFYKPGWTG